MTPEQSASGPAITVYTAPGCPDCAALRQWLTRHGHAYTEKDLSAPGMAADARRRYGIRVAPITIIGTQVFYGMFTTQLPAIEQALQST
ncbi:MAG: glutaredoxin family protein [Acidiferrobacteraceae bacterium]